MRTTQLPWAINAGFEITSPDDRLIGPFNAFLHHPEIASRFLASRGCRIEVHHAQRAHPRNRHLGGRGAWAAEYELYAHSELAANAGIDTAAIQALAHGEVPTSLYGDELIAAELAQQLSKAHRIDDALYRAAETAFGRRGLFDIVALMGQYLTVSALAQPLSRCRRPADTARPDTDPST